MEPTKNEIEINGVVTVPQNVDADRFTDEFIEWLVSMGYFFGGSIGPYISNSK